MGGASFLAASCGRDPFLFDRACFVVNEFFALFTRGLGAIGLGHA